MNVQRSNGWFTALAMAGVALMTLAITTPATRAATESFNTAPGAKESGGNPVSASATFTSSAGTLSITLRDLLANPKTIAQLLSDLTFTVSSGTLTGSTLSSSAAQLITVAANGTFTLGSTVATGWGYTSTSTTGLLDDLNGNAGPNHLIIGPPGGGGTYSNANSSIAGNGPHNPYLNQTATFTISGSGITASTIVTSATFSFGTTTGNDVPGKIVPEPSTMAIGGLGALGFIGYGLRRRLKK